MMFRCRFIAVVSASIILLIISGCDQGADPVQLESSSPITSTSEPQPSPTSELSARSPEVFVQTLDYEVKSNPDKFTVDVPQDWEVGLGEYPVGLYWRLANEFSKDAGLDLTPLKGTTVDVWRYSLVDGLPGSGDAAEYTYPSNLVLLVQSDHTVGAWLEFNTRSIGPSIKKRSLTEITGLTLDEWVEQEGLFTDSGDNEDLASLGYFELLDAFFLAIQEGNYTRANACLSSSALLTALTVNLEEHRLYNSDFGTGNSLVENIVEAKPNSYKLLDDFTVVNEEGHLKKIEVRVDLYMKWLDPVFNSPDGQDTRFAVMTKQSNGWKIEGLGTGP